MNNVVQLLKEEIEKRTTEDMTSETQHFITGLKFAVNLIEDTLAENLVIGNTYFVVLYENGNTDIPYVSEMKLYKITEASKRPSYCFTFDLKENLLKCNPDLVLASKRGLSKRVFYTREQAQNSIKK